MLKCYRKYTIKTFLLKLGFKAPIFEKKKSKSLRLASVSSTAGLCVTALLSEYAGDRHETQGFLRQLSFLIRPRGHEEDRGRPPRGCPREGSPASGRDRHSRERGHGRDLPFLHPGTLPGPERLRQVGVKSGQRYGTSQPASQEREDTSFLSSLLLDPALLGSRLLISFPFS